MPRPVSIIVWRDAKSDPPTLDGSYLVKDGNYPTVPWAYDAEEGVWFIQGEVHGLVLDPPTLWAEWPEPNGLTDDDVRDVTDLAEGFLTRANIAPGSSAHEDIARLRAALGGEKEEA